MTEFAPTGGKPRMTKAQVRKYIKQMEDKREKARLKLEKEKLKGELDKENDLGDIEKKLKDAFDDENFLDNT